MIQKVLVSGEDSSDEKSDAEDEDNAKKIADESDQAEAPDGSSDTEEEADDYTYRVVVYSEDGLSPEDGKHIYLIDHAWTYKVDEAQKYLDHVPGLTQRMANLFDLKTEGKQETELKEKVLSSMWKFNQTYRMDTGKDQEQRLNNIEPFWYVMDEFGTRVQHSDEPSVRMVPFYYNPRQCSYSLMWPIKCLQFEDEVTRDYVEYVKSNDEQRRLHLIPWQPYDCSNQDSELGPEHYIVKFDMSGETLPDPDVHPQVNVQKQLRFFSDVSLLLDFYEPNEFYELTDSDVDSVDVQWTHEPTVDHKSFGINHPDRFTNSFPCEGILTMKNVMYPAAMRYRLERGEQTDWLQETYDLTTELKQFVQAHQTRAKRGDYKTWIVKPCYLSRSLDMQITDNLDYILRLSESIPKLVSEYIDRPVLYDLKDVGLVKWDLRYMVLLHTVKPLKVFIHKTFMVRVANKPFSMSEFEDFEKHFTTMNSRGLQVYMIQQEKFIRDFETQYPDFSWSDIEAEIFRCSKLLMESVTHREPPHGIARSPQSRALYGLDVMLKWTTDSSGKDKVQPVILECNYGPDFYRICLARKKFFTDVCRTLFLNDTENVPVVEL